VARVEQRREVGLVGQSEGDAVRECRPGATCLIGMPIHPLSARTGRLTASPSATGAKREAGASRRTPGARPPTSRATRYLYADGHSKTAPEDPAANQRLDVRDEQYYAERWNPLP